MIETNNYYKKAPTSDGYKMQIGCRVPQSVHDRLRDLAHKERFTSFSAFLETVLTNYDNQKSLIVEMENSLSSAGQVFKNGLAGMESMQNEARDITELRFFFFNAFMDVLEVDSASRNVVNKEMVFDRNRETVVNALVKSVPEFQQIAIEANKTIGFLMEVLNVSTTFQESVNKELIEEPDRDAIVNILIEAVPEFQQQPIEASKTVDFLMDVLEVDLAFQESVNNELIEEPDRETLVNMLIEAVPEFQQTGWEDSDTVKTIAFSETEMEHINAIVNGRIEAGMTDDIYHFIRQCVDFSINYDVRSFWSKEFSVPENTKEFHLTKGFYEPTKKAKT